MAKNGGNYEKFTAAYGSFGVNNQTVQADKMAQDYEVTRAALASLNHAS